MRTSVLRLLMTLVASATVAVGGIVGHTMIETETVATGGPNCWDWSPPDP